MYLIFGMLKIPKQYNSLEYIKPVQWKEISDEWREMEAGQAMWKEHWEKRGFSSWDEWRKAYAAPLEPTKLNWQLFKIKKPLKDFPKIYGVPSRSWIDNNYGGEKLKVLKEIIELPYVKQHAKVIDIKNNFPGETMMTGLIFQDKIILVEGMHRALALAGWTNPEPPKTEITIALAQWNQPEIPVIGGNYKNKN